MPTHEHEFYTVSDAAALLRVDRSTIHGMIKDGRLIAAKAGREYRIHRSAIDAAMGVDTLNREQVQALTDAVTAGVLRELGAVFGLAATTIKVQGRVPR
jgi:excisionase family DNA binding protein